MHTWSLSTSGTDSLNDVIKSCINPDVDDFITYKPLPMALGYLDSSI